MTTLTRIIVDISAPEGRSSRSRERPSLLLGLLCKVASGIAELSTRFLARLLCCSALGVAVLRLAERAGVRCNRLAYR